MKYHCMLCGNKSVTVINGEMALELPLCEDCLRFTCSLIEREPLPAKPEIVSGVGYIRETIPRPDAVVIADDIFSMSWDELRDHFLAHLSPFEANP